MFKLPGSFVSFIRDRSGSNDFDKLHGSDLQLESLEPRMLLSAVNIFAAGSTGQETVQLIVDGNVTAEFQNVGGDVESRNFVELSFNTPQPLSADQVAVRFINDAYDPSIGLDRNVVVDRVVIDGITYQTEHPETFVSSHYGQNGFTSGKLQLEQLNVNGQFQYSSQGAENSIASTLIVNANGWTGEEQFQIRIDGQVVRTFTASQGSQSFQYQSPTKLTADQVRIQFINDAYDPARGIDNNLVVESITIIDAIDNKSTQFETSDARVFSTGTWTTAGFATGYGRGDTLHVDGYFQFSEHEYRSIDGTGNNQSTELWNAGAADTQLPRYDDYTPAYGGDGYGSEMISDGDRPGPRDISNAVSATTQATPNSRYLNDLTWLWGQFIDHDLDLSTTEHGFNVNGGTIIRSSDPNDIMNPGGIPFTRSDFLTDDNGYRQQVNVITSFIDASNVYGSDHERSDALRTFTGGRLKTGVGNLLPTEVDVPNDNGGRPDTNPFVAGDIRANENVGLASVHSLFVREHNRLADLIAAQHPAYDDEQIFQLARNLVGAELQIITYNEFLPALLGESSPIVTDYHYDDSYDPSVFNSFAHAAFRFGHSMLSPSLRLASADGSTIGQIALRDAFFNPEFLQADPARMEQLLAGAIGQRAQEIDVQIVDDVRNFLFGQPGAGGLDLASLNIQRGRDHGLPDYNSLRELFGLARVNSFAEITSDVNLQNNLASIYGGDVNNIDPWVGGLAEDHAPGSAMGELMTRIISEQFTRLRDGDRLFYLADDSGLYNGGVLKESIRSIIDLDTVLLSDILRLNTNLNPQQNVFYTTGGGQTLTVNAFGEEGSERFNVVVDGQLFGSFQASRQLQSFAVTLPNAITNPSDVRVQFLNDDFTDDFGFDRNLVVQSIQVGSLVIATDSPDVYSTGTWLAVDGLTEGFGRGDRLHANGYFQYLV